MRRYESPFDGKRYLLNRNTGEIHDLDNETEHCHINDINPNHIVMASSYMECLIAASIYGEAKGNGCYYCLRDKDNG